MEGHDISEDITDYVKIGKDEMKNVIVFLSYDIGVKSIKMQCTSKSVSKRPWQRVNYMGCPVRLALCE